MIALSLSHQFTFKFNRILREFSQSLINDRCAKELILYFKKQCHRTRLDSAS